MKKFLVSVLTFVFLTSLSIAGPVINLKFHIGKRSQPTECPGFGFCKIEANINYSDGYINGTLEVNNESGTMTIGIVEKDILKFQPDKIIYFKGSRVVTFEEEITIPSDLSVAAKCPKTLLIKKGEYLLTYKNGIYFIEIPL